MIAKSATERRRTERRVAQNTSFWRTLKGERRVRERRRYVGVPLETARAEFLPDEEPQAGPSILRRAATGTARNRGASTIVPPSPSATTDELPVDLPFEPADDHPVEPAIWSPITPADDSGARSHAAGGTFPDTAADEPAADDPATSPTGGAPDALPAGSTAVSPEPPDPPPADTSTGSTPGDAAARRSADAPASRASSTTGTAGTTGTARTGAASPPMSTEERRRAMLRHMLRASEARQKRADSVRRPVLAKGTRVRVVRGDFADNAGVILDADYIESRVLLRLDGRERPCWVPFSRIGSAA